MPAACAGPQPVGKLGVKFHHGSHAALHVFHDDGLYENAKRIPVWQCHSCRQFDEQQRHAQQADSSHGEDDAAHCGGDV